VRPGSTEDNVKNSVKNMMKEYGFKESDYTLTYTDINVGVSEPITVHINVPYTNKSLTGMGFLPLPDKIQGHGTMVKEGAPTGS